MAGAFALAACVVTIGRMDPLRPSLGWSVVFAGLFLSSFAWLTLIGRRSPVPLGTALKLYVPLLAASLVTAVAIYASDDLNHQVASYLQPTAPVLLLLLLLSTAVAHRAAHLEPGAFASRAAAATRDCTSWAVPASLILLGLVQGGSYIWTIGNDFTRYWNDADAVRTWSGYPGMITLPDFAAIGEPRYTIDLPLFGLALIPAFGIFGHDTFAAYVPNLLANTILPLLLYAFYRRAGIGLPIAFAGSCALTTMPFLRLYTLNAPLSDTLFITLLVGTAVAYERLLGKPARPTARDDAHPPGAQASVLTLQSALLWILLGVLAGLTALTRSEGLVLLGFFALGLVPNLRQKGPWLAAVGAAVPLLPFAAIMYSTYGFVWPNNAGNIFSQRFVADHFAMLQDGLMRRYGEALGMPEGVFVALLVVLAACSVAGTIYLARENWRLALLPGGGMVTFYLVLTVDPTVSGARLWFDFFRHISYGLPFLSLAPLFLLDRLSRALDTGTWFSRSDSRTQVRPATFMRLFTILLVAISMWQMVLLMRPSQTYGASGTQLLNSDVWVTIQDLAAHRYQLPILPHAWDAHGVLIIEPSFDEQYLVPHLDRVRQFFEPYTVIATNRGAQYEVASILLLLFGSVFALAARRE